jgi:hypothetical protein
MNEWDRMMSRFRILPKRWKRDTVLNPHYEMVCPKGHKQGKADGDTCKVCGLPVKA